MPRPEKRRFLRACRKRIDPTDGGCGLRDGKELVEVDGVCDNLRELLQLFAQIRYFIWHDQPQVTTFQLDIRKLRQPADDGNPTGFLDIVLEQTVHRLFDMIEDHTGNAAVRFEVLKALNLCRQRRADSFAVDDQNGRCLRCSSYVIGACLLTDTAQSVIIAHDTFDDRDIAIPGALRKQPAQTFVIQKESV